jgi:hypothetical protein
MGSNTTIYYIKNSHSDITRSHDWLAQPTTTINMGVGDMDTVEQPWDASTRSIRYTAAMGDRLLEQIDLERERVSIPLLSICERS